MQNIIRSTRNSLEAQLASGMPACAGGSVSLGPVYTGFADGVNLWTASMGLAGMQCSGGRISGAGDDI